MMVATICEYGHEMVVYVPAGEPTKIHHTHGPNPEVLLEIDLATRKEDPQKVGRVTAEEAIAWHDMVCARLRAEEVEE